MKVSYNWLHQYLNFSVTPNDLADALTSTGLEVESVTELFSAFDHLVIGKVLECKNHPNADRLKITKVDVGGEVKQIICGANNVRKNQLVVVVLVGNKLINQKGEIVKIKKTKIRGEISEGMICAEDEIGLGYNHDGIIDVQTNFPAGTMAAEYFKITKDYSVEIGLTPNRTDAFGHIGVCRDLYAYYKHRGKKMKLSIPNVSDYRSVESMLSIQLDVVNNQNCPYYSGVCIKNVVIQSSPRWLQNKLISIGLKPINNVVDVTNFVLHETGNPLHAFDFDKIIDSKIIVRNAKKDEVFKTLESNLMNLHVDDLVICDAKKPLCLAGVIGGLNSCVTDVTKNIFLESAFFDSQSIRKTSKRHAIISDSSYRFERGVDYSNCDYTLKRAALLIQEICGGEIGKEVSFSSHELIGREIDFSFNFCEQILGHKIDKKIIIDILESLDFKILINDKDTCRLEIPSCRVDVCREIDIVEEIARIYGYDNIPTSNIVKFQPSTNHDSSLSDAKKQIGKLLISNGFFEIQNNSLIPESSLKVFNTSTNVEPVKLLNPLSQDLSIMRSNMFFGGLQTIKYNLNRQINDVYIFEFGKIYQYVEGQYIEQEKISIFGCGIFKGNNWMEESKNIDFFFIKGVLEKILNQFRFDVNCFELKELTTDYHELGLAYLYKNNIVAEVGLFSTHILSALSLKKPVYYIDINLELLLSVLKSEVVLYNPVPRFPSIKRDLSLLIDKEINYLDIKNSIEKINNSLLKSFFLFDVYEGEKIEKHKKSYAISFLFQDSSRTLTDHEVDKALLLIYNFLETQFNLSLRDGELLGH